MNRTPIEWVRSYAEDGSFHEGFSVNPIRFRPKGATRLTTMCQKVSPGCAHCYAEGITRRFWPKDAEVKFPGYTALGVVSGEFVLVEKTLLSVLKRKKPARIFWGDMTDLFQASVPDEFLDRCFAVAALTPHLTHMFLTKRPERMFAYLTGSDTCSSIVDAAFEIQKDRRLKWEWPLPNMWLGTSVESAKEKHRIDTLREVPAALRFLSLESLLGDLGELNLDGIGWVIVGGESGAGARPMHPGWARSLRDQCKAAGVPFFFKQWGEWAPGRPIVTLDRRAAGEGIEMDDVRDEVLDRVGTKAAGCLLDGVEHHEFPAVAS